MPRQYFRTFPLQSEELGDSPVGSPSPATDSSEDDTVKKLLKKLRDEADTANKKARDAEAKLAEIAQKEEEEKAKRSGDFEALRERLLTQTSAQIEAERKDKEEKIKAIETDASTLKAEWKSEKITAAFSKVLKPEFAEQFAEIPRYQNLVEVTKNERGKYEIVVVESASDRTPRFKSDGKKTVPFTLEDLAEEIAAKIPSAAKPINRASGDNISHGNGQRRNSEFNLTASSQDLIAKGLGL